MINTIWMDVSILYFQGSQVETSTKYTSVNENLSILANSAGTDEMPRFVNFIGVFTVCQKYPFRGFQCIKVNCEFVTFPLVSWVRCGT